MPENPLQTEARLTQGDQLILDLVNNIKDLSKYRHDNGKGEDKEMDRWGAELVNSVEYQEALAKIKKIEEVSVADPLDRSY